MKLYLRSLKILKQVEDKTEKVKWQLAEKPDPKRIKNIFVKGRGVLM